MARVTQEDCEAAEELVLNMHFISGVKTLRELTNFSLRYCLDWAEGIARRHPESVFGESLRKGKRLISIDHTQ